jgi:hypothetical protein
VNHTRIGDKLIHATDITFYRLCQECARVFDLRLPGDADEWTTGHDCEDNR